MQSSSQNPLIIRGPYRPDLLRLETLPDLFEITAQRFADKTALIFGDRQLTYAELDHAALEVGTD